MHMMLSIRDMCQNDIQHHAPYDEPYSYTFIFVFHCIFLFYKFQPVLLLINFHIVHLFLSLDVSMLRMF